MGSSKQGPGPSIRMKGLRGQPFPSGFLAGRLSPGVGEMELIGGSQLVAFLKSLGIGSGSGGGVPSTRSVNTTSPLSGGGDLSADLTLSLDDTAVTPDTYGDAGNVGQFTVDQKGRITHAENVPITPAGDIISPFWNTLNKPVAANFTLVQGTGVTAALTDLSSRGTKLKVTSTSGSLRVALQEINKPATSDWTMTALLHPGLLYNGSWALGLYVKDNAGKIVTWGVRNGPNFWYAKLDDINTFNSSSNPNGPNIFLPVPFWIRVAKVSTNFIVSVSYDGETFIVNQTVSTTDFLGATISTVGILIDNQSNDGAEIDVNCYSFTAA